MNKEFVDYLIQKLDIKSLKQALGNNATITEKNFAEVNELISTFEKLTDELNDVTSTIQDVDKDINALKSKGRLTKEEREELKSLEKEKNDLEKQKKQAERKQNKTKENFKDKTGSDNIEDAVNHNNAKKQKQAKLKKAQMITEGVTDVLTGIASALTDIHVAEMQKEQNLWMAQQQKRLNTIDATSKIFTRNLNLIGKTQESVFSNVVTSITQGASEGAYASANSMTDLGVQYMKNIYAKQQDILHMQFANQIADMEAVNKNLKLTNKQLSTGSNLLSNIGGMLPGAYGLIGSAVGSIVNSIVENRAKIVEAESDIEIEKAKMQISIAEKVLEKMNEAKSAALDTAQSMIKQITTFSKAIEDVVKRVEQSAKKSVNLLGIDSKNVQSFYKNFSESSKNLKFNAQGKTVFFNKNDEDMLKIQTSYVEASERNQVMNNKDMVKTFQLGTVLGDDQLAATLLGDMDYFNKSIANGTDLIYEMFQKANKAGVSNRKFAKELQQNLKLAQKYTFKGGVKGMMEMSLWAQKTRFNMQSLDKMVGDIREEGLEGIIQRSAKLQVLGGNAALGSNPLAMMYEAWNDAGALGKRFHEMTAGLGYFNQDTGEVVIQGADAMMLKSIAEETGQTYEEAAAQVTQRIKSHEIDKQLTGNYTDDEKALIYSKAQLNQDTGEWEVTLDNGIKRGINDIQKNEWAQLMPTEEAIETYVKNIYDLLSKEQGVSQNQKLLLADLTKDDIISEINKRIENTKSLTQGQNLEVLVNNIIEGAQYATMSQENANSMLLLSTARVSFMFDLLTEIQRNHIKNFNDANSEMNIALNSIAEDLNMQGYQTKKYTNLLAELCGETKKLLETIKDVQESVEVQTSKHIETLREEGLKDINNGNVVEGTGKVMQSAAINVATGASPVAGVEKEKEKQRGKYVNAGINSMVASHMMFGGDMSMSAQNIPMLTAASQITPINDGNVQLAQSHPQDSAIFAKVGGPFDKLFNGVFSQINSIYNGLFGNTTTKGGTNNINLNMNGRISLDCNGTSVDISNELKNNPMFVKAMAQEIVMQLSRNVNGGKTTLFDYIKSIKS